MDLNHTLGAKLILLCYNFNVGRFGLRIEKMLVSVKKRFLPLFYFYWILVCTTFSCIKGAAAIAAAPFY